MMKKLRIDWNKIWKLSYDHHMTRALFTAIKRNVERQIREQSKKAH